MRTVSKIFAQWGIRHYAVVIALAFLFPIYGESVAAQKTLPPRHEIERGPGGEVIPRKVLVLDFANQAKDTKSDYLSVSVAEALLDPLKKTGKFYLLPRQSEPTPRYNPHPSGEGYSGQAPISGSDRKKEPGPSTEGLTLFPNSSIKMEPGPSDSPVGELYRGSGGTTFDEGIARERGKAAGADVVVIGNFVSVGDRVQIQTKAIDVHTGQIAVAKTTSGKLDATVFDLIQKLANDMSAAMASALPPIPKQVVVTQQVGFGLYAKDFRTHAFVGAGLPLGAAGASFGTIRAAPDLETQSYNYNVFTMSTGATLDASLAAGTYTGTQSVTLTCSDNVACNAIAYTTDGSTPAFGPPANGTLAAGNTATLTVSATTTVKYITRDAKGNLSAVGSGVYTISGGGGNTGTALWARSVTAGSAMSVFQNIVVDADRNVYAVGRQYVGTNTYGIGIDVASLSNNASVLLVKYDSAGIAQWGRSATANSNASIFRSIAIDGSGDIYTAGEQCSRSYTYGSGVSVAGASPNNVVLVKYQ